MPKPFTYLLILTATISCNQPTDNREKKVKEHNSTISMYSEEIRDSFFISVNLPEGYETTHKQPYPVAYVLDANFQFDMHAVAVNKYTEMGLLPPLILVGIGYADAGAMDSLGAGTILTRQPFLNMRWR